MLPGISWRPRQRSQPPTFDRCLIAPRPAPGHQEPLGELGEIVGGIQKSPRRTPVKFHCPYLTVRNVRQGHLDLTDVERFEVTEDELSRLRLMPGDLLLVEGNGSLDHIGRSALYEGELRECVHQNHIIRVRLAREVLRPGFLHLYLKSETGKAQLVEKARTSSGLYSLGTGKIATLRIPVPNPTDQEHLETKIAGFLQNTKQLERLLSDRLAHLHEIRGLLLRKAFSSPSDMGRPRDHP